MPDSPQNGSLIGSSTAYPDTMDMKCDKGFSIRGFPKIKCLANGTWSKTSSFCEGKKDAKSFEFPKQPENGTGE